MRLAQPVQLKLLQPPLAQAGKDTRAVRSTERDRESKRERERDV